MKLHIAIGRKQRMKQLRLDIVVNEFGSSKKFRAMCVIAGQAIISPPCENETEAVLQLFSSLGNRQAATSQSIEMSIDIALSGYDDAKSYIAALVSPKNDDLRYIDGQNKAGEE